MASQSVNDKVLYILENLFSEICEDLHVVYGDSWLSNGAISKWMNCFKDGSETTEDDKHTG